MRQELLLASKLFGRSQFVPLSLTVIESDEHIYAVYPTRTATSLRALLDDDAHGHFTESATRYYAASAALALEHLHAELPAQEGVVCRNLSPDVWTIDELGRLQHNRVAVLPSLLPALLA